MIFFTDENISEYLAKMLGHFDRVNEIRAHRDYFEKGTRDVEWIKTVASWGNDTVIIGGDGRILKNRAEKAVLKECDITFVLLASGWLNLDWNNFAWKMIKVWPEIVRSVSQARFPMLFEVSSSNLKVQTIGRISNCK